MTYSRFAHLACAAGMVCASVAVNDVRAAEKPTLGLQGFCPVSILAEKQWRPGASDVSLVHDGRAYRFATAAHRDKFRAAPAKYVPVLGGDCVVTHSRTGKRVAGKLAHAAFYGGRLMLFANDDARERFRADSGVYAGADLAYGGRSPIALVDDERTVRGEQEFEVFHRGFRYWFASGVERDTFLGDPEKYAVEKRETEVAAGEKTITATGRSSCAYCDHKVWPLLTKGELGLAIKSGDTLYIVEHADTRFPELYNARFDNGTMTVTGREIKREGNTVWLVPDSLVAGT